MPISSSKSSEDSAITRFPFSTFSCRSKSSILMQYSSRKSFNIKGLILDSGVMSALFSAKRSAPRSSNFFCTSQSQWPRTGRRSRTRPSAPHNSFSCPAATAAPAPRRSCASAPSGLSMPHRAARFVAAGRASSRGCPLWSNALLDPYFDARGQALVIPGTLCRLLYSPV